MPTTSLRRFKSHIGENDDAVIVTYSWDGHAEIESVEHDIQPGEYWDDRVTRDCWTSVTDAEWDRLDGEAAQDFWADR